MALPLGKKSLIQIERRQDPLRRVVELGTLLEWLLRLENPDTPIADGCPPLAVVVAAYALGPKLADAVQLRDRLVHVVGGPRLPTAAEAEKAAVTFNQVIQDVVGRRRAAGTDPSVLDLSLQVVNDPLGETTGDPAEPGPAVTEIDALRARVQTALWRLDVITGRRAAFTRNADDPVKLPRRLSRHAGWLRDVGAEEVARAMVESGRSAAAALQSAAAQLEAGLDAVSAFDAAWKLAPGIPPLPAIRLEPDVTTRLRLLVSAVEHQLSWIPPVIEAAEADRLLAEPAGSLVLALLDHKGHLIANPDAVREAVGVRNRLVRVVPDGRPVLTAEIEGAEAALWQAAYNLRGHCSLEHADAMSAYADAPLRTLPAARIRTIGNTPARLDAWYDRLVALALVWEGKTPGAWCEPSPGADAPSPWNVLRRHPRKAEWALPESADDEAFERAVTAAVGVLEVELGWAQRPAIATPPPLPKPVPAPAPARPTPPPLPARSAPAPAAPPPANLGVLQRILSWFSK